MPNCEKDEIAEEMARLALELARERLGRGPLPEWPLKPGSSDDDPKILEVS